MVLFFIFALCNLFIRHSIDVGIDSASVVDFGILGVVFPFVHIIIGILVLAVDININFYYTDFTS